MENVSPNVVVVMFVLDSCRSDSAEHTAACIALVIDSSSVVLICTYCTEYNQTVREAQRRKYIL